MVTFLFSACLFFGVTKVVFNVSFFFIFNRLNVEIHCSSNEQLEIDEMCNYKPSTCHSVDIFFLGGGNGGEAEMLGFIQ